MNQPGSRLSISRLSIRHLRMIAAIVEEGNLVRAAKALNMSQSAVTKALQELEALMKAKLFERTNRGVVPTLFGQTLADHARLVILQLARAEEHLADLRDGSGGRVVIGTLLAASAELLPKAIARVRKGRPNLEVKIVEGTHDVLIASLRAGELDLVVGRVPEHRERSDIVQEVLMQDIACVVARHGHPLAARAKLELKELTDWEWILPPPETSLRGQINAAFRQAKLDPPPHAVESVSLLTNLGLLIDADYLGVLPFQVARREAAHETIVILPVKLQATAGSIGITTLAQARLSPAAEVLVQALRDTAVAMRR